MDANTEINRVAIVGTGLIGGSSAVLRASELFDDSSSSIKDDAYKDIHRVRSLSLEVFVSSLNGRNQCPVLDPLGNSSARLIPNLLP